MPRAVTSSSRPMARVKSALPSASIRMSSPTAWSSAQARMTKASLTEMQAITSIPLALIACACCLKPGRCLAEQVGVKAPGTANRATRLPAKTSSVFTGLGPSAVASDSFTLGSLSPTLMVMAVPPRSIEAWQIATVRRASTGRGRCRLKAARSRPNLLGMDQGFFAGQLLIAMPGISDPRFERALILVCAHDDEHAMGLAVNRPVDGLSVPDLLEKLEIKSTIRLPPD